MKFHLSFSVQSKYVGLVLYYLLLLYFGVTADVVIVTELGLYQISHVCITPDTYIGGLDLCFYFLCILFYTLL